MNDSLEAHLHHQADLATRFFWHRLRWRALRDHLPAHDDLRLLDVGAGTGVTGELLARDRPAATYLFDEPIPSLAQRLEHRFGPDANRRGHDDCRDADVVTLLDVIEHVDDPHALLADTCRRCRPGTRVVITVPAGERLWSQWDVALGHRRRYTRRTLSAQLADLPLEMHEISRLFPELLPAALWRAWRNPPQPGTGEDPGAAELPDLPGPANDVLYLLGLPPVRFRRRMPCGTSLLAAATVREATPDPPPAPTPGTPAGPA